MLEDFRSRMGEVREEMDQLARQAEEMERVVQEQQVRLEELDLLVRQRDEQLAEQQARVEELEGALRQRDQEIEDLRAQLAQREEATSQQRQEIEDLRGQLAQREETISQQREEVEDLRAQVEDLRAQLAQREAAEVALREELTRAQAHLIEREAVPEEKASVQELLARLSTLEDLVRQQNDTLAGVHSLIQEEMGQLHSRLDRLEAGIIAGPAPTPVAVAAPPVEEAIPLEEVVAPAEVVVAPEAPPEPVEVIAPPIEVAVAAEDPLQAPLYAALEMLPEALAAGLAGLDGLGVEIVAREKVHFDGPLEVELAELATSASRVAAAIGTGPLLTLAFQTGAEHCLVSPVGQEYFAFLLIPADSTAGFRQAQAVLLQAASRLSECC